MGNPYVRLLLLSGMIGCAEKDPISLADTAGDSGGPPCTPVDWWPDGDGDGYGSGGDRVQSCEAPAGFVDNDTDCDDADAAIHPAATEACNGVDDDCDGEPDQTFGEWYTDADQDGYGDPATGVDTCTPGPDQVTDATDCDDADASVHPGADEVCGDLDDDDCDGLPDTGDAQEWHTDDDGDGFGHMYNYAVTCDPEPGWVLDGTDCRPNDAEAFPGATERCNDDDDDCDRQADEDFERDGDGHLSAECGGDDCDDDEAGAYPGAEEICDNGVDDDCDGRDARCGFDGPHDLGASDVFVYSGSANFDAGRVVDIGDLDADGLNDIVVATMYADGYNGGAYVLPGSRLASGTLDAVGWRIEGDRSTYAAGRSIGVGDVSGDGIDDVAIGAPDGTDKEWIVFGPITGDMDLADGDLLYEGTVNSEAGHGSDVADVNGDGVADAVIGAYEDATGAAYGGVVYLEYGPLSAGTYDLTAVYDARLVGDSYAAYAGRYLRAGADVDGDGIGDILAAAPYSSSAAPYAGEAYLVYGGVTGDLDFSAADGTYLGESANDYAGEELNMGDVDGDGLADVILGSYNSTAGYYAGSVYVVYGPASGTTALGSADIVVRGSAANQQFGLGLAADDVDGDGVGDLLVGGIGDATAGSGAGGAWLFFGPLSASLTVADASASFYGGSPGDQAGEGLAIGDVNGDGANDLVFGAPAESTGGSSGGAVHVVYPQE